jgi:pilus assembly protein CpaC
MKWARIAFGGRAEPGGRKASRRSWLHRRALGGGLAALCTAVFLAAGALPAQAGDVSAETEPKGAAGLYLVRPTDDRIDVKVTIHKSETVRVGIPFSEALVGNAEVADVVPLTDRTIYIVGKKVGVTRLALLDNGKQMIGVVDVEVTYDLEGLQTRMKGYSALDDVQVQSVNGQILLTGVVHDAVAMQSAVTLAKQLSDGEITNAIRVAAPQQVMLEVRFIEADRTASRALGVNASVQGDRVSGLTGVESFRGNSEDGFINNLAAGLVSNSVPFGSLAGRILGGNTTVDVFLKALEERGLARRLAEPNLVALSGDTASFLAGGEFPFPVSADNDKVSVQFKKFGVGLAFTPTVLADGVMNLKIEPEVSELDTTNFIRVSDGIEIPSLIVRRASTTVELRDGQSFAIAGLLQSNHVKNQRQLPWLGDVPVLGALLRSAAWQKKETDLVIIITPRLVKPRAPGQKLATPLDGSVPTNDKEFFLRGRHEIEIGQPDAYTGHIIDYTPEEAVSSGWKGEYQ